MRRRAVAGLLVNQKNPEYADLRCGQFFSACGNKGKLLDLFDGQEDVQEFVLYAEDGHQVKVNPTGKMAAVFTTKTLSIQVLKESKSIKVSGLTEIVWVGWCPRSHLGDHFSVLTSSGTLQLYRADFFRDKAVLQSECLVKSCEDWTLKCVSAAFGETSLFILLENGDVIKVETWLPLPAILGNNLRHLATDNIPLDNGRILASKLAKNEIKVDAPCLIQPEPIEATGEYRWVQSCEYRGLTLLLVACGPSRIDVLLDATAERPNDKNPLLILLESIELPSPKSPGSKLSCHQFDIEGPPKFLVTQSGSATFLMEFTWADQFVDSIIYNVSVNMLTSKLVPFGPSDAVAAFPFQCPATGSLMALTCGAHFNEIVNVSSAMNKIADKAVESGPISSPFKSSLKNSLEIRPEHCELPTDLSIPFTPLSCPPTAASHRLQDLTEDSLLALLDDVADPLRTGPMAHLIAASNALTILAREIDDAIVFQAEWLAQLSNRTSVYSEAFEATCGRLDSAKANHSELASRLSSLLEGLKNPLPIDADFSVLVASATSLLSRLNTHRELPTSLHGDTNIDSESLHELSSRLARLKTSK